MPLTIEHRDLTGDKVLVAISGRVMLGPEGQAIEQLIAELLSQGKRRFVIDLSGVTHIDSTGIGRFIASFNRVFQAGGKLVMAGAGGQVRDSFAITRLDTVFRFFPDNDTAQAALN